jgi:hypothetical protein
VVVEVEGIGRLENTVVELDRDLATVGTQPAVTINTLTTALALSAEQAKQELQAREQRG